MTERDPQVRIAFDRDEQRVLLARFELSDELRKRLDAVDHATVECSMTVDEADELREQAGELFQLVGLGPDDTPSDEGRILDRLIDKLFTG